MGKERTALGVFVSPRTRRGGPLRLLTVRRAGHRKTGTAGSACELANGPKRFRQRGPRPTQLIRDDEMGRSLTGSCRCRGCLWRKHPRNERVSSAL